MSRKLHVALIISLVALLLAPCVHAKTKITYWAIWGGYEKEAAEQVVKWFNESQDEIEVEYVQVPDYAQKLLASIAAGDVPDVAFLWSTHLADFAYRGGLEPLDQLMELSDLSKDEFIPVLMEQGTINGKVYALPTLPWTWGLYYNKAMLHEAGLDPEQPPQTITELDSMVEKLVLTGSDGRLERLGMTPWAIWDRFQWAGLFGGSLYDETEEQLTFTDPNTVEAFSWLSTYSRRWGVTQLQTFQGGFGSFFSETYPFWMGKTAFDIHGTWMGKYIENNVPDMEWGMAAPPVQSVKYGTSYTTCDFNVIPKGAKHPKEAFEFLKFWYKPEISRYLSNQFYTYSPIAEINKAPEFIYSHDNPVIELNSELAMRATAFRAPNIPVFQFMLKELDAAIDEIVYLKNEPEIALQEAEKKVERELQKVIRRYR